MLRKCLLEKRSTLQGKAQKSIKILADLKRTAAYQNAETIFCYISKPEEVETQIFITDALAQGKQVFVPYCPPGNRPMQFYRIDTLQDVKPGAFGVLEPDPVRCQPIEEQTGLCVVPAIAFDKKGFRLGYGKGYYDRFLSHHNVYAVGLCFEELLLDALPVSAYDRAVHQIITQSRQLTLREDLERYREA